MEQCFRNFAKSQTSIVLSVQVPGYSFVSFPLNGPFLYFQCISTSGILRFKAQSSLFWGNYCLLQQLQWLQAPPRSQQPAFQWATGNWFVLKPPALLVQRLHFPPSTHPSRPKLQILIKHTCNRAVIRAGATWIISFSCPDTQALTILKNTLGIRKRAAHGLSASQDILWTQQQTVLPNFRCVMQSLKHK